MSSGSFKNVISHYSLPNHIYSDGDIIIIIVIGFLGLSCVFALIMLVLLWWRWYFVGSVGISLVVVPTLSVDGK